MRTVFDPLVLHQCANAGVDLDGEAMFDAVTSALVEAYPEHIQQTERSWIFNNAGGAMGQLTLLYASINEYLIFFGSPIGTEGHSGRYRAGVWDFVMSGEMWCYLEGEVARTSYGPGDAAYLAPSKVKGYRIPDGCWMLEYARGPIPAMLPFGLADSMLSTLDLRNVGRTVWQYGQLTTRSILRRLL